MLVHFVSQNFMDRFRTHQLHFLNIVKSVIKCVFIKLDCDDQPHRTKILVDVTGFNLK